MKFKTLKICGRKILVTTTPTEDSSLVKYKGIAYIVGIDGHMKFKKRRCSTCNEPTFYHEIDWVYNEITIEDDVATIPILATSQLGRKIIQKCMWSNPRTNCFCFCD